ncbi:MAG: ABC transporter permease [Proteobacteria bacterium]|nr:ABC transporter permease [Pseudomonadota bacterium]
MTVTASNFRTVRRYGAINWLGVYTLYAKEVHRYLKIAGQTVFAPLVTSLLFLAVFSLALGRGAETIYGTPYLVFLAPGLIVMAVMQNAFANTSSSMIVSKIQGTIVDVLMPPLSAGELTFAFVVSGATRGAMVAVSVLVGMSLFVPIRYHDIGAIIFFTLASSLVMSLIGLIVGIWAEKFDNIAFITNFVIMPLSFLSGTFYSIDRLPDIWRTVLHANPFFYMIDGVRYGFTGHAESSLWAGTIGLSALIAVLWAVSYWMFLRGYKLKD